LGRNQNNSLSRNQKGETVDQYFDAKVADPYRWLEDDRSAETAAWVKAENEVTYGYLDQIPFRDALKKPHGEIVELRKNRLTFKEGNLPTTKNNGLQNQSVMYRKDAAGKKRFS
jgi:prolyl oligopeptidase